MSEWWLVAERDAPDRIFIAYELDGVWYPPPLFGEPRAQEHLILIATVNMYWLAEQLQGRFYNADEVF